MRKLLTPLVFLALLLSAAALTSSVMQHRERYIGEQQADVRQDDQAEANRQAELEALEAALAGQNQKNERLLGECQKGEAAYNALTAFNKNRLEMPVCQLEEIQNEETTPTPTE